MIRLPMTTPASHILVGVKFNPKATIRNICVAHNNYRTPLTKF